MNMNFFFHTLF